MDSSYYSIKQSLDSIERALTTVKGSHRVKKVYSMVACDCVIEEARIYFQDRRQDAWTILLEVTVNDNDNGHLENEVKNWQQ